MIQTFSNFERASLPDLSAKLDDEYYKLLKKQSAKVKVELQNLEAGDTAHTFSQYISLCHKLVAAIDATLLHRSTGLITYINALVAKSNDRHDCRYCTGTCRMAHTANKTEIEAAHNYIRKLLYNIEIIAYNRPDPYINEYILLEQEIVVMDRDIKTIFYIEETYLLKKIAEYQYIIHAS